MNIPCVECCQCTCQQFVLFLLQHQCKVCVSASYGIVLFNSTRIVCVNFIFFSKNKVETSTYSTSRSPTIILGSQLYPSKSNFEFVT
jgi:hypothetical protein